MEFTLVQEGLTPLTEVEMVHLVDVVDNFFAECVGIRPMRFDHLAEDVITHAHRSGWASICSRIPTTLEIMAACCTLESRGSVQTEFQGGLLCFVETRATNRA